MYLPSLRNRERCCQRDSERERKRERERWHSLLQWTWSLHLLIQKWNYYVTDLKKSLGVWIQRQFISDASSFSFFKLHRIILKNRKSKPYKLSCLLAKLECREYPHNSHYFWVITHPLRVVEPLWEDIENCDQSSKDE